MSTTTQFYENSSIFLNYSFIVEIDGIEQFGFKQMNELNNETEIIDYKEGGLNAYVHQFPAHTTFSNIVLKHGLGINDALYEWRQFVLDGQMDQAKRNGTIKFYTNGNDGSEVTKVWYFYGAWPFKLEISEVDATSSGEVIIESIELVIERFERG